MVVHLISAPSPYPFDLFEHLWTVDRLQRLGISRFFDTEVEECINYVKKYENNELSDVLLLLKQFDLFYPVI